MTDRRDVALGDTVDGCGRREDALKPTPSDSLGVEEVADVVIVEPSGADRSRAQPATSAQRIACHLPAVKAVHDMAADHRRWVDRSARIDGAADLRQPHRAALLHRGREQANIPVAFRADTCSIQASGPRRRCLTRKRCSGHGWRMRGSGRNFFGDHVHATPGQPPLLAPPTQAQISADFGVMAHYTHGIDIGRHGKVGVGALAACWPIDGPCARPANCLQRPGQTRRTP
jgi:hypothetical protein